MQHARQLQLPFSLRRNATTGQHIDHSATHVAQKLQLARTIIQKRSGWGYRRDAPGLWPQFQTNSAKNSWLRRAQSCFRRGTQIDQKCHRITVVGRLNQQPHHRPPINTWVGDGAGTAAPPGFGNSVHVRLNADAARTAAAAAITFAQECNNLTAY